MENTQDWTLVRAIPGCLTFHRFHDGRLAASHGKDGVPDRVRWVDVNSPALLDAHRDMLRLPIIDAETGKPGFISCPRSHAPVLVLLTGCRVEPAHLGDWLEEQGARYLQTLTEGMPGPKWTFRAQPRTDG